MADVLTYTFHHEQVTMFMRVVNLLLEYFALIRLKYTEPDTPRPFVVPGGKLGAYLIVLPTIALSGTSYIPPVTILVIYIDIYKLIYVFSYLYCYMYIKYFVKCT